MKKCKKLEFHFKWVMKNHFQVISYSESLGLPYEDTPQQSEAKEQAEKDFYKDYEKEYYKARDTCFCKNCIQEKWEHEMFLHTSPFFKKYKVLPTILSKLGKGNPVIFKLINEGYIV